MVDLSKIINYLANEQCALVIGPEIMRVEEQPLTYYLRDQLYAQFSDDIVHYYRTDGLFLFPPDDESVKSDLALSLKRRCQELDYDEEMYRKITTLPFHLVISINP